MTNKKNKPKVPDLSKEDPVKEIEEVELGEKVDISDKSDGSKPDDKTEKKPRYVTVESVEEDKKEKEEPKAKEAVGETAPQDEKKEEPELKPPISDTKVAPSFSLLDAEKKSETEKKEGGEKAEIPAVKKDENEIKTPEIKLGTTPISTLEKTKEVVGDEKSDDSSKEVKKWLTDTPITEDSGIEESKGIGKKIIIIVVIVMILAGVVGGGFYYYKNNMSVTNEPDTASDEQIVVRDVNETTPTPTPEEEEEVDLTKFTVSVLNGSGIPGEAGNVSDLLIEAGFSEPDTGNAESYDYGSTQVSLKDSVPESMFDTISDALSVSYDVSSVPAELDDESTYDIIVIVGSDEPEAEPTATPTPEELEE